VGAVLQLVARAFTAVGIIMQRAAMDDESMVMLWRVGLITYMVTTIPDMLSYLLAPQAVLTVLSSVEPLLVSVLVALLLPRDAALITPQHSMATALCVAGTLGCVLFAPHGAAAPEEDAFKGIWDSEEGAERLFHPAGAHRLMLYLAVVVPVLVLLSRQVYRHVQTMGRGMSSKICFLQLPLVAAMSLALQRLALGMLGASLRALNWQPLLVLQSPTVLCTAGAAVVCMLMCAYHVCQGVLEVPPHIFVPLYCALSALLQLFQSMAIMQEFRDEPAGKVLLPTFACAAVSLLGIMRLSSSMSPQTSKLGHSFQLKANELPSSRQHDINCLEPVFLASRG